MKDKFLSFLINEVSLKLDELKKAFKTTQDLVKEGELIAESKWDTRSIEAGYLAGAQKKRIKEVEYEIQSLLFLKESSLLKTQVVLGALIETEHISYLITECTGGMKTEINGKSILAISSKSPLFQKLLNDEIKIINIS